MICRKSCVSAMPKASWINKCKRKARKGGISRIVFLVCDPDMVLPNEGAWENPDNWIWALCNGYMFVTGPVLGSMPKGSFNKKRFDSCSPERTTSGSQTVAFQDYNADDEELQDFDFWKGIMDNLEFLLVGWLTCDELFYRYNDDFDLEIGPVSEDTKEGFFFRDGVITMSVLPTDLIPVKVPGILNALESFVSESTCYQ
jgi:hypothetical protein